MRWCIVAVTAGLMASTTIGQEMPKPTPEGVKVAQKLAAACITAGAIGSQPRPNGKGTRLVVTNRAKAEAAVKEMQDLQVKPVCDALVSTWAAQGLDDKVVFAELLDVVGEMTGDARTRGFASYAKAVGLVGERKLADAVQPLSRAAERFAAANEFGWQAQCLDDIGFVYRTREDAGKALEYYARALDLRRKLFPGDNPVVALNLTNVGLGYVALDDGKNALETLSAALKMWQKLAPGDNEMVAMSLHGVGQAHGVCGDSAKALEYHARALEMYRKSHPAGDQTSSSMLERIALAHLALGDARKALEYSTQALNLIQRIAPGDNPNTARVINNVGAAHLSLGDLDLGMQFYTRSLEMRQRLYKGDHKAVAENLNNVGAVYGELGDSRKSLDFYIRSLEMHRRLFPGDHPRIASTLNNMGAVYRVQGNPGKSLDFSTRALEMWRRMYKGDHADVARGLSSVGASFWNLGDARTAMRYSIEALEMRQRLYKGDHPDVAVSLNDIGAAYHTLGDPASARNYSLRALEMRQRLYKGDHPDVAESLDNVGVAYSSAGEFGKALDHHIRALEMKRRLYKNDFGQIRLAESLICAGLMHNELGNHRKALEFHADALRVLRTPGPAVRDDEPLSAAQLQPHVYTLICLVGRALARTHADATPNAADLRASEQDLALAVDVLDRLRGVVQDRDTSKLRIGEETADLVPARVNLLLRLHTLERKPGDLRTAFAAAEQGRARVLLESLTRRQAARLADAPADLRDRETALLRAIRSADARIARLDAIPAKDHTADLEKLWKARETAEAELSATVEQLRKVAPRYADLRYPKPCALVDARAALNPGEVALHFVLGSGASYLILLEKEPVKNDPDDGLAIFQLPARAEIDRRLSVLLDEDTLRSAVRAQDVGAELYQMLLAPAAGRLKGKALVVIPDGPLCYLPFQLLVDPDDRYLVETHRVRYAPSMTTLHLTRQWVDDRERRKDVPDCALFALGDPDYGPIKADPTSPTALSAQAEGRTRGEAFLRLKNSGREVADLEALFGKDRCRVLVRGAATESAVKRASTAGELAKYRYLHFACHGMLGRGPGQPPGLVLSLPGVDGKEDDLGGTNDGYLRADEVLNLRLNADLVVLSACRSGKGRLYAGEGVEGFARAFLYAGSRGVVCSLWAVDDTATAELMGATYARLKDGETAADALRAAQLALVKAGRPPFYWAAFVLNGQ